MAQQTKLNLRLLRKVRNRIAKIPESYYQGSFCDKSDNAPCGTTACIAGEAVILSRPTLKQGIAALQRMDSRYWNDSRCLHHPAAKNGQRLLGLSDEEADMMFGGNGEDWPEPYRSRFERAVRPETKAKIAVAYLDECLKRKAVTW